MAEGLSAAEVGKEIGEHAKHSGDHGGADRRNRLLSIVEALLLSLVAALIPGARDRPHPIAIGPHSHPTCADAGGRGV